MTPDPVPDAPPRVGIFGGTFDPPHVGHVRVVADVADALGLGRVVWVPAGEPPHKRTATPAALRLAMALAAAREDDRFEVSSLELERPGPSYTVDTLRELRRELPESELFLILGADQYRAFDTWRDPDEILALARLAVMDRNGASARASRPDAVSRAEAAGESPVLFVPVERIDVSSSGVRAAIRSNADIAGLVPESVREIIAARGLYRG